MELGTIIIIVLLVVVLAALLVVIMRKQVINDDSQGLVILQNQVQDLARTIDSRVNESSKQVNETIRSQFDASAKLIRDVTVGLTKLDETNRQVVSFADQLQGLQDILKNPKQRGVLGEYYLETLLKNTMPPGSYEMQHRLGKDEDDHDLIPDAVVFVKDKIIPIDSKFSLENFNRMAEASDETERARLEKIFVSDLKNRIVETSKYIRPQMGTLDFAFMFIPHEAIYYDLLVNRVGALKTEENENLIQRAASKYKVIIVSPTSFLAYLQTVLQGLRAMQIEEQATAIIGKVGELGKHLKNYEESHVKLGNSLSATYNHYMTAAKAFKMIDKDVTKITGAAVGLESPSFDKPGLLDEE